MSKAAWFSWIIGGLSIATDVAIGLSNQSALSLPLVVAVVVAAVGAYFQRRPGDVPKIGHVAISELPKEWQDILAGIGGAPIPLDQQPANSNGVLAAVPRIDNNVK